MEDTKNVVPQDDLSSLKEKIDGLHEEILKLKSDKSQDPLKDESFTKIIDELVDARLKATKEEHRLKVEEAKEALEKAQENERLQQQIYESNKYNASKTWIEQKEAEYIKEIDAWVEMIDKGNIRQNFFHDVATNKDKRAIADFYVGAKALGGAQMLKIFKENYYKALKGR